MAGIGFRLREMFVEDTYTGLLKGYLYSAIISSGPWLFSILCLALLGIFSSSILSMESQNIFRATIVYTFAFSLIFTGITQMVFNRYLADKLYLGEEKAFTPTFITVLVTTILVQFIFSSIFYFFCDLDVIYKITGVILYITISCIWQIMIFLSATKDYRSIVFAFFLGSLTSFLGSVTLGKFFGLSGYLNGFTIGQLIILFMLTCRIFIEFSYTRPYQWEVFGHFKKYPDLALIGLAYNLAIWVDKFIYWFSREGVQINSLFYSDSIYGNSMFIAYITIVPSMALFLARIETDFYDFYRDFYGDIINKRSYDTIQQKKEGMISTLKTSLTDLLKFQGIISLAVIIFAPTIIQVLKLQWVQLAIFRVGVLGAFLQVLLLITTIILLYLEFRGEVLLITLVFLIMNVLFTFITLNLGFAFYGFGYAYSCLVALLLGFYILNDKLNNLEYLTFARAAK